MVVEASLQRDVHGFKDEEAGVTTKIDNGVVGSYVKGVTLPEVNFSAFFGDVFARHKDETALVDARTGAQYTFGELHDASLRVAAGLRRLGLRTGDIVCFHATNGADLVVAMCGTFFAGGTAAMAKTNLTETYGMTELAGIVTFSIPRLDDFKSVGKPSAFVEMKVVDTQSQKNLGALEKGEIFVKSPGAFKGYLGRPEEMARIFQDGFIRTGDTGFYAPDGRFFVCGRLKELIKCMDQQVAPAEIEELLAADTSVRHVVVAGVPHPEYGEAARAFVVLDRLPADGKEESETAARLRALVANQLSFHKHLHGGVEFLESIPQTDSGKELRSALQQSYMQKLKRIQAH
ncbi:hypothetical protein HPB49_018615 [Dermacentor silvarum]|uniref:Uncharacterized protein n=1 Tax=Dermacentor silvarum TaxID=543639 RepID=A0ACB8E1W5_DERSI|nr:hypothetical protein HPB49_018615 [Dermacentor silvarum]